MRMRTAKITHMTTRITHAGGHGVEALVDLVGAGVDVGVHQPRDDEQPGEEHEDVAVGAA